MTTPQHARARRRRLFGVNRCPECHQWLWTFRRLRRHWKREH